MKGNKVDKLRNGIVGFDIENEDSMTEIDKEILRLWFNNVKRAFLEFNPLLLDAILLSMKQTVDRICRTKFILDARAGSKAMSVDETISFLLLTYDIQLNFIEQEKKSVLLGSHEEIISNILDDISYFNKSGKKKPELTLEKVYHESSMHLRRSINRLADYLFQHELDDEPYNPILTQLNPNYSAMDYILPEHYDSMTELDIDEFFKEYYVLKYNHFFTEFRGFSTKLFKAFLLEMEDESKLIELSREEELSIINSERRRREQMKRMEFISKRAYKSCQALTN